MTVRAINTCIVTGRVSGDSDACGDCDPCIYGRDRIPDVVKRLLAEKDEWRDKYAAAMERIDELIALPPSEDNCGTEAGS